MKPTALWSGAPTYKSSGASGFLVSLHYLDLDTLTNRKRPEATCKTEREGRRVVQVQMPLSLAVLFEKTKFQPNFTFLYSFYGHDGAPSALKQAEQYQSTVGFELSTSGIKSTIR